MAKKSKVEELTGLLKDLEATTPDIEASAAVSVDGLMRNWKFQQKIFKPCTFLLTPSSSDFQHQS